MDNSGLVNGMRNQKGIFVWSCTNLLNQKNLCCKNDI